MEPYLGLRRKFLIKAIELGLNDKLPKNEIEIRLAFIKSFGVDAYVNDLYRALGKRAMEELELNKDPVAKKAAEVAAIQAAPAQPPKKRFVSQKTREKMSAAQKRRHGTKRKMSEEGKARIAEAQRKRWERQKAEENKKK